MVPDLASERKLCCGCSACMDACPVNAITMVKDEKGFVYPKIDDSKCVGCNTCMNVCAFKKESQRPAVNTTYAVSAKDEEIKKHSSSGGVFPVLAKHFLDRGGVVYGAAYVKEDGMNVVKHIEITDISEIPRLQGSKYVKSDTTGIFKQIVNRLKEGKEVLFTGTPCQVGAAKMYVEFFVRSEEQLANFYTMEIVCHGTPSQDMLNDYLKFKGKAEAIIDFRDKEKSGWSTNGSFIYPDGRKESFFGSEESYYRYFLAGALYRESCYNCKYASENRASDITAGDYWGIESEHPEFADKYMNSGVSVLVCNSEKGKRLFEECKNDFEYVLSDYDKAATENGQLRHPAARTHHNAMECYSIGTWAKVEEVFRHEYGLKRYTGRIKAMLPDGLRKSLKRLLR